MNAHENTDERTTEAAPTEATEPTPDDPGSARESGEVRTTKPRGNPESDRESVEQGEEQLEKVSGN